ncbi:MAG: hypothetical protein JWN07_2924, partial [Hyphomicrobiales bacterium]|nr:hypothetical protein [Hyphomicrobiales bacterium]
DSQTALIRRVSRDTFSRRAGEGAHPSYFPDTFCCQDVSMYFDESPLAGLP